MRRGRLLAGLSAIAILAGARPALAAQSAAQITQQALLHPGTASTASNSIVNSINAAAQAQAALSAQSLARAAQALKAVQAAQSAAQAIAAAQVTQSAAVNATAVTSGAALPPMTQCTTPAPFCGLVPDTSNPGNWVNISAPTAANISLANPNQPVETLTQQATANNNAIGTWSTFNLAPNEVLDIVQPSPTANLLFRINDANPSQIRGQINANGQLYLINHNGIIFTGTSQINTHALIATSLDIGPVGETIDERNDFFLNTGIGNLEYQTSIANTFGSQLMGDFSACDANCGADETNSNPNFKFPGSVWVQAGAQITTNVVYTQGSPDQPGFVYLFAPYIENDGTITTPEGEVMMATGERVVLDPGFVPIDTTGGSTFTDEASPYPSGETVRGTGLLSIGNETFWITLGPGDDFVDPTTFQPTAATTPGAVPVGTVVNNGNIQTPSGTAYVSGVTIQQNGVIEADTSVERNGSIILFADQTLTLGPNSALLALPVEDGETTPIVPGAANPYQQSVISLTAQIVDFQGAGADQGAIIVAPDASVAVNAKKDAIGSNFPQDAFPSSLPVTRIEMETGSLIDVSGINDVLPMSANFVTFEPRGQEFANSPLQRDSALFGQPLTVDIRLSGTNSDGTEWIGTPLADASGYVNLIERDINYLMTPGGSVSLNAAVSGSTGTGSVVLQPGSTIAASAGSVQYLGGVVATTELLGANGEIYNIGSASPLMTYVGIAGDFTVDHPQWNVTSTYDDPLLTDGTYEPGYTDGAAGGSVSIRTSGGVLEGTLVGGTDAGARQLSLGTLPSGGSLSITNIGQGTAGAITVAGPSTALPAAPSSLTPLSTLDMVLSGAALSGTGFSSISLSANAMVIVNADATLSVPPGAAASINLSGTGVDIQGVLRANSGSIAVVSRGADLTTGQEIQGGIAPDDSNNITIGAEALLDVSGLWVNDTNASADTLAGPGFLNGGSISLTTDKSTSGLGGADYAGNIVLLGMLDVSSGGRIQPNGTLQLAASGLPAGNGGNISLQTEALTYSTDASASPPFAPGNVPSATVELAGPDDTIANHIEAFGFAQGGTFTLQVPTIRIGTVATGAVGEVDLAPTFFTNSGFSSFNLTSVSGGIEVEQNTVVQLSQQNFVPSPALSSLATGSELAPVLSAGFEPIFERDAMSLSLSGGAPDGGTPTAAEQPLLYAGVDLEAGSSITTDPGAAAAVDISTRGNGTATIDIGGTITVPGGTISITDGGVPTTVILEPTSRLDVSGAAVFNSSQSFPTGTVLPGGTVNIELSSVGSSLLGESGAVIDVSGASAIFDVTQTAPVVPMGVDLTPTVVWSDAGSITLSAETLLYDGSFAAEPGGPEGNGGSLTIAGAGESSGITVVQQAPTTLTAQQVTFVADTLTDSGIVNLSLLANGLGPHLSNEEAGAVGATVGSLSFSGAVDIQVDGSLVVDAQEIMPLSSDNTLTLNAGYVDLENTMAFPGKSQGFPPTLVVTAPDAATSTISGTLLVQAGTIDIENLYLEHMTEATFVSTGDIRFSVATDGATFGDSSGSLGSAILTAGNLTFDAAQLYPVSGVEATIKSVGAQSVITFQQNGATPSVPLSAGGSLTVDAYTIVQDGTVRAPLGTITLGVQQASEFSPDDPLPNAGVVTNSVTLGAGSLTSVSLDDALVPFGETTDGQLWTFLPERFQATALQTPPSPSQEAFSTAPEKQVNLNTGSSGTITLSAGATIDLSGGGDIYATEFVPGTGGTVNVLTQSSVPSGATVYAILPGYNSPVAPIDLDFADNLGNVQPAAGSEVYLSGGGGLAAGYYTLLPAYYATLPGAYRIVVQSTGIGALPSQNETLADGTMIMSGYLANSITGSRSALTQQFDVQSSAVWQLYSQINITQGNTYFGNLNAQSGNSAPRLPADVGEIAINAGAELTTDATLVATPGSGGRDGTVEIAASSIEIIAPGVAQDTNYNVAITTDQIDSFVGNAGTLIIGGDVTFTGDEEEISAVASQVEVDDAVTNGGITTVHPLRAPEIVLIASSGITVDTGSAIDATGSLAAGAPTSITTSGDGALLRVANGGSATITVPTESSGMMSIGAGASLTGDSIALQSAGSLTIDPTVQLNGATTAPQITLAADGIVFSTSEVATAGLDIVTGSASSPSALFTGLLNASQLSLDAIGGNGTITFAGTVPALALAATGTAIDMDAASIVATGNGTVSISAGTVSFVNSGLAVLGVAEDSNNELLQLTLASTSDLTTGDTITVANVGGAVEADGTWEVEVIDGQHVDLIGSAYSDAYTSGGTATLVQAASGAGSLVVTAGEVDLGAGNKAFGFATIGLTASQQVVVEGTGALNAGTAAVTLTAPQILLDNGAQQAITTTGALTLTGATGAGVAQSDQIGGQLTLTGGSVTDDTVIQALAGDVTLEATSGDLTLGANAQILAQGYIQQFFDTVSVADGGTVTLTADNGNVTAAPGAVIDVAAPTLPATLANLEEIEPGGDAGQIVVNATQGTANLQATLLGSAPAGNEGGSFTLDAETIGGGNAQLSPLDALALNLTAGGFTQAINIREQQGDLTLTQTLTAQSVTLTADGEQGNGGVLTVSGTINASGAAGGSITLSGGSAVDLSGATLLAEGSDPNQVGGSVEIETSCASLTACGGITLGGTTINVSGGSRGGNSGGTVRLRAPVIENNDGTYFQAGGTGTYEVAIYASSGTSIIGATSPDSVVVEGYQAFDAKNYVSGSTNPLDEFNGVIDPAANNENNFFTTTLAYFVENFRLANGGGLNNISTLSNLANFQAQPGIELDNSSSTVNGGNITVQSVWNLGAVTSLDPTTGNPTSFLYRVGTGNNTLGAPGVLTLRAVGSVNIDASITDGFYIDPLQFPGADPADVTAANSASPNVGAAIGLAQLFPLLNGTPIQSWSYNIVAGADLASADPLSLTPLTSLAQGQGDVVLDDHMSLATSSLPQLQDSPYFAPNLLVPTTVRTGTGFINVAAAQDVVLTDQNQLVPGDPLAPGVIYIAGHATPADGFTDGTPGCTTCLVGTDSTLIQPLPSVPEYPTGGGNLTITAQRDIDGFQDVVFGGSSNVVPYYQFWSPWLIASETGSDDPGATVSTTWWINFGSFDQGFMDVGGNVTITAGRNLNQVSVSLPTTLRETGTVEGAVTTSILEDSGNLVVTAGGDMISGSYYEGDGTAQIRIGGSVEAGWTALAQNSRNQPILGGAVSTVLAVDTGSIDLTAGGSIALQGIVSPVSLQLVNGNAAGGGESISSYGPTSAVRLQAVTGDITAVAPLDSANEVAVYEYGSIVGDGIPDNEEGYGAQAYPATFEAVALRGNLTVPSSIQLAPSDNGVLDLEAYQNLSTYSLNLSNVSGAQPGDMIAPQYVLSTGPSLVFTGFDALAPLDDFTGQSFGATILLDPTTDATPDHFYALTGDILDGAGTNAVIGSNGAPTTLALAWQISKPSRVEAGQDIIDLNFDGQNLQPSDVTSIIAGRDLFYTGVVNQGSSGASATVETLRISGPGFFDVEAGRNLGPFVLSTVQLVSSGQPQGIVATGNVGTLGNATITTEDRASQGGSDPLYATFDPTTNVYLPVESANISALFGVSEGINYVGVIAAYIDPAGVLAGDFQTQLAVESNDLGSVTIAAANTAAATPSLASQFRTQLVDFLNGLGPNYLVNTTEAKGIGSIAVATPANALQIFEALPPALQDQFVLQIFFAELQAGGVGQSLLGYQMINTLFPAAFGYTNDLSGNPIPVETGNLDLLHATIQTQEGGPYYTDANGDIVYQGGNISILGPGGSAIIGSIEQDTVTEFLNGKSTAVPVPLQYEGLLTLDGGSISTFTDENVEVNQSRIFTEQGGNVLMWSSNGDLDAGRGAKTSASFPPLAVSFPEDDTELVDLAGLVTGAGIAVLQSTPEAPTGDAYLIAPHGVVNAGDAGVRVSGNLTVVAPTVLNAGNINVGGSSTGVPSTAPPVSAAAQESANSATGSETNLAAAIANGASSQTLAAQAIPSLITVEVLGYGGIDQNDPRVQQFTKCGTRVAGAASPACP